MRYHFLIDSSQKRALDACRGSMHDGDGDGHGLVDSAFYRDTDGSGRSYGYSDSLGGGWGCGYGSIRGHGSSSLSTS